MNDDYEIEPYLPIQMKDIIDTGELKELARRAIEYENKLRDQNKEARWAQYVLKFATWRGYLADPHVCIRFSPELQYMFQAIDEITPDTEDVLHPLLGEYVISHIHPDDVGAMQSALAYCVEQRVSGNRDIYYQFLYRIRRNDGSFLPVRCTLTWWDFDEGVVHGITQDTTQNTRFNYTDMEGVR